MHESEDTLVFDFLKSVQQHDEMGSELEPTEQARNYVAKLKRISGVAGIALLRDQLKTAGEGKSSKIRKNESLLLTLMLAIHDLEESV
jgi:hypothetical protein